MKYIILSLFLISCTHPQKPIGEKSLAKKDAPVFLLEAVPNGPDIEDVEYFIEQRPQGIIYEVKYEKNDQEISLEYDDKGTFLEREEDIEFSTLPEDIQKKIQLHLSNRFGHYKIHETEKRKLTSGQNLIDIEVSHLNGLMEVSFSEDGTYISEEVEEMPEIETLN